MTFTGLHNMWYALFDLEFEKFEWLHKDIRKEIQAKKREATRVESNFNATDMNANAHNRSKD